MKIENFSKIVWDFYHKNKRIFPWREMITPYNIVVSEIMLQQTQVSRVLVKYPAFLLRFPDFNSLTTASLEDVLREWQGMGYNRRAKYLKEIAEKVIKEYKGILPTDADILMSFPGIGKNTAGSIVAFAFNKETVFIETNIRRVMIHHFFQDKEEIDDKDVLKFVEKTLDKHNPRDWYYALMDYGAHLSKVIKNPNKKSKHYSIQSKFEGSTREVRSKILKLLIHGETTKKELYAKLNDDRLGVIINGLIREGFVREEKGKYTINN